MTIKQLKQKLVCEEKGASLVLVALSIVVLMGFAALSVDAGMLYKTKREMVTAADAAALAGAKAYVKALTEEKTETDAKTNAKTAARNYAVKNSAHSALVNPNVKTITYNGAARKVIEVTAGRNEEFTFAKVLGFDNTDVSARAMATWGFIKEINGGNLLPLFCTDSKYNSTTNGNTIFLHDGKLILGNDSEEEIANGNWGYFNIGSGNTWKEALKGDLTDCNLSINNPEEELTGNKQALIDCIEERMDRTAQENASMCGMVPIVDEGAIEKHGSQLTLPILYFATFLITDIVTDNDGTGSTHADCDLNIETPAASYPGCEKGTIIGHFTSNTIEVEEVIHADDQQNPNPGGLPPSTYVKLIE